MSGGGQIDHVVIMANQIALNLGASRDAGAAARRALEHMLKFWTPAMRAMLAEYAAREGEELLPALRRELLANPDFQRREL